MQNFRIYDDDNPRPVVEVTPRWTYDRPCHVIFLKQLDVDVVTVPVRFAAA